MCLFWQAFRIYLVKMNWFLGIRKGNTYLIIIYSIIISQISVIYLILLWLLVTQKVVRLTHFLYTDKGLRNKPKTSTNSWEFKNHNIKEERKIIMFIKKFRYIFLFKNICKFHLLEWQMIRGISTSYLLVIHQMLTAAGIKWSWR